MLGIVFWIYSCPLEPTIDWLSTKFENNVEAKDANILALKSGFNYAETTEIFSESFQVAPVAESQACIAPYQEMKLCLSG
ncbi:hypothetical protein NI379_20540 [Vibrio parahaemolyticus]|nr:hypothetical protein NI379_20540 [Vibrio parahaemolyticus]